MRYWLWFVNLKGIGPILQGTLLDRFHSPEVVFHATRQELLSVEGIGPNKAEEIIKDHDLDNAELLLSNSKRKQIQLLPYDSYYYPERLRKLSTCPKVIYYKGDISILQYPMTAVVGARRCTKEAKNRTVHLVEQIVEQGDGVISGMAKGIDSYAHTTCLNHCGKTIAVLGNGLDICYPPEHAILMKKIEEKGLLLSEYPPGHPPTKYTFPQRNRLIAALAKQILIPEANRGSGVFITEKFAKQIGVPVIWYDATHDKSLSVYGECFNVRD